MPLNVFIDNSNIWLVGCNVCAVKEPSHETAFRIHFSKLFDFVCDNRPVSFAYVGGSVPPNNDDLWKRLCALGTTVETQERSASGGEVAVDEVIQLQMANRILDVQPLGPLVLQYDHRKQWSCSQ